MRNQSVMRPFCPKTYNTTKSKVLKEKPPSRKKLNQDLKTKVTNFFLFGNVEGEKHDSENLPTQTGIKGI